MAEKWKELKKKMEEKRDINKKNKEKTSRKICALKSGSLTVQRLSTFVSGKAQKYARAGPREFVPYQKEDITFDSIKEACKEHFASRMDSDQVIDILAGEQGPSCRSVQQIPNLKLIHIRFVSKPVVESDDEDDFPALTIVPAKNKKVDEKAKSVTSVFPASVSRVSEKSVRVDELPERRRVYPKSISILDMMKLGKVVENPQCLKTIQIFRFRLDGMFWSSIPEHVEFNMETESFAEGGFRSAFKAVGITPGFKGTWVIKQYLPSTLEIIKRLDQTPESHTKRAIQMNALAKNFAEQMAKRVEDVCKADFGRVPFYHEIFFGKLDGNCVSVEPFIEGEFCKYINNTGVITGNITEISKKAECLAHFSYAKSSNELMLLDLQGNGYCFYDPEISSSSPKQDGEILFCAGNLSARAIDTFIANHKCNFYCHSIGLQALSEEA